jgi:outer membrane protein OmpA-like peptidoglycan-associated protein
VKDDPRGTIVTFPNDALFENGTSELTAAGQAKLDEVGKAFQEQKGKNETLVVFGYTDSTGSRDANVDLSFKRAVTVREYLIGKGVAKENVSAQGMGPDHPLMDNATAQGRTANSRIEIIFKKP